MPEGEIQKILANQTDKPLPEHIPEGIKKYDDFKPLARGGIASIQTCTDLNLGRRVVLKSLLPDILEIETEKRRFIREARLTSLLQHPNTPTVFDLGKDLKGNLYFTMQYLKGVSLKFVLNCLARNDRKIEREFSLKRLIKVLIETCDGIEYAHKFGVIHRDLKPGNIQIGAFDEVMILDWGIAKVWDAPTKDDIVNQISRTGKALDLTQMGPQPGTPLYMSPEQIRGDEIDERTDIYSIGAILYEMITMNQIFNASSIHELLVKTKNEDVVPPSIRAPERYVPEEVEEICLLAIHKDREKRFQKVSELTNALKDFMFQASSNDPF